MTAGSADRGPPLATLARLLRVGTASERRNTRNPLAHRFTSSRRPNHTPRKHWAHVPGVAYGVASRGARQHGTASMRWPSVAAPRASRVPGWQEYEPVSDEASRQRQTRPAPGTLLYHYTDAAGLLGIVQSGGFPVRATDVQFLNDGEELVYAATKLVGHLEERAATIIQVA